MKAQELRVGNLVKLNDQAETITDIVSDHGKYFVDTYKHILIFLDNHSLKPIPLTEEWLIRLGFEKHFNGYFCERDYLLLKQHKLENKWFVWVNKVGDIDCTRINSVHQLQNLYFALTGQELELKETK